ncbi:nuclear transport factor 2 family protein [Paraglaciecola aquimarina]|uniref:Nuclear transport factor 2 family protein n=1 Tax=Paraglaciecola aquimarina TaxID=1235557 RepID=A0ABU3T1Z0_9ALTE|nr:nuclear transport factor 2 family protein [Paraglaciecola aquimarina]MDU0356290.1 nuclear transport factor 2 family protein [Paraglaciecola aquimarina]
MKNKLMLTLVVVCSLTSATIQATDNSSKAKTKGTLATAQAFLEAAGTGNGIVLNELMTEDFVWHNEGDKSIPWIGPWQGKEAVFDTFMPAFGAGLKVTSWTTDYRFENGEQAVFMGTMSAIATNTGVDTGKFTWTVRVHVVDGKVKSWNWMEDSFAVSEAFHATQVK